MSKIYLSLIYGVLGFFASARYFKVFAETIDLRPDDGPFKDVAAAPVTISKVIQTAISMVLLVAALAFFFMLVLGGIRWIMSGGEKGNVENARKQITSALIGLAIIFVAWAIINFMGLIFGVNLLQDLKVPTLV